MKRLLTIILVIHTGLFSQPGIKKISSITKIHHALKHLAQNTLIVSDIDLTLVHPTEQLFYIKDKFLPYFKPQDQPIVDHLIKEIQKLTTASDHTNRLQRQFWNSVDKIDTYQPVEPDFITFIKDAQKKKIKVIALTSNGTADANRPSWKVHTLQQIGLDLSASFKPQYLKFTGYNSSHGTPMFYKGILCAALQPKGQILTTFLNTINWRPGRIIFFDNKYPNCENVLASMKELHIPCQCYWYTTAYKNKLTIDASKAEKQLQYWQKHHIFLPQSAVE
jgi:hypothetical protein